MSLSKPGKRKLEDECRTFNEQWTTKYFFIQHQSKPLCLICRDVLSVFKEYNIKRHYESRHGSKYSSLEGTARNTETSILKKHLTGQQNIFKKKGNEAAVRASFRVFRDNSCAW